MNIHYEKRKLELKNERRNQNISIDNLERIGIDPIIATRMLNENMTDEQLVNEFGFAPWRAKYICRNYITEENLINFFDVDREYAEMIINTFSLTKLFQKYGVNVNVNGLKKSGRHYEFCGGSMKSGEITLGGYIEFNEAKEVSEMFFKCSNRLSELYMEFKNDILEFEYYIFNSPILLEKPKKMCVKIPFQLPIKEKTIITNYICEESNKELILSDIQLLSLLSQPEKLDELMIAYENNSLNEYLGIKDNNDKILRKTK